MISGVRADAFVEPAAGGLPLSVRKAVMHDVQPIMELINGYAAKGLMLPRTEFDLSETIRDFSVVATGGYVLGCGALHFYSPTTGEIRSLAVCEEAKTRGVGRLLVEGLVQEALDYELDSVFAFTYVPGFFEKVGFHTIERGALPLKVWKDCVRCSKFQDCDEIAVLRILEPDRSPEDQPDRWGVAGPDDQYIQIPSARPPAPKIVG